MLEMSSSTKSDDHRIAWLSLKLIPGLGNRSILRLFRHFGSPEAVLRAKSAALAQVPGLRPQALTALRDHPPIREPGAEWRALQSKGIRLLCLDDPDYPANLAAIPDAPAVLFVQGVLEPRDLVSVAVVGSRAASAMGLAFTERLCADLAQRGVTIVSGLAVGIDSAAHRGALKAQGRTLAVLGCGLDIDYPSSNRKLRRQIDASGASLSEFPLGTLPEPAHFPSRNRIISGLALGVVVVEAAQRSGSLITARLALEQGREVFAVPGLARHYRSVGPHQLLRQGAKLVETAEDILEEIRPMLHPGRSSAADAAAAPHGPAGKAAEHGREETALLDLLDRAPVHIDELCRTLHWPASRVAALLLALELKGAVMQLPGKYFARSINSC
jgi:DNA processing protein